MILIGQYDSPFVRRVAIAMRLYGIPFEQKPWSAFGDRDKLAAHNPLLRVPTLVLENGDFVIESTIILDYLDEMVGPDRALIAERGESRRKALQLCALATGIADKGISTFYGSIFHERTKESWKARCRRQITGAAKLLEERLAELAAPFWFGRTPGHADIAAACALRFVRECGLELIDDRDFPKLAAHNARCEALEVFREISQPFVPPR